jgi:membrane-anchored mycosin MYCP
MRARIASGVAVALLVVSSGLVAAGAALPPIPPQPPFHYKRTTKCVQLANTRSTLKSGVSWAQQQLDYTALWQLGVRGRGSRIAVIDTGVNPVSAFTGRLMSGGDYVVAGGDGQQDCDGHGTLVAGLIAAAPDQQTGFAGVAPGAQILPIRQSSDYYGLRHPKNAQQQNQTAGNTTSLAAAIEYAVARGATVINISEASCTDPSNGIDPSIQPAVDDAVRNKVVVVASAGNVDDNTACKQQNTPGKQPVTYPSPADLDNVLSVAAVDENGDVAPFSLAGPWVDVAAPGVDIISTNPVVGGTGQINEFITSSGVNTLQGTSFAAPYVAGLAALIQERFPGITAQGVIRRIEQTAEHPSAPGGRNEYIGYGMIDPAAALTAVLPGDNGVTPTPRSGPQTLPAAHPHHDTSGTRRRIALYSALGLLVLCVVVGIALGTVRRTRRHRGDRVAPAARESSLRTGAGAGRGRSG